MAIKYDLTFAGYPTCGCLKGKTVKVTWRLEVFVPWRQGMDTRGLTLLVGYHW